MAKVTKATNEVANETNVANSEATTEAKVEVAKKPEPTSAKLIELRTSKKAALVDARAFEPDSEGEAEKLLEAYKIDQLIKAEIANIVNAERQAELQIARNARVQLNIAQFVVLFGSVEAFEAKLAELDEATKLAFDAAQEAVNHELLAKFSAPKTATKAGEGTGKATTDGENLAAHLANIAAGMTDAQSRKALEEAGVPRSTAWHTVNNYNKSLVK